MKNKNLILFVLVLAIGSVSAQWWNFGNSNEQTDIPNLNIGREEYIANLSGGAMDCSSMVSCLQFNTSAWYRDQDVNTTSDVTFNDIIANSFSGDGSALTNVGLGESSAVTISTKAGENIDKGQCVYISGAIGQIAQVKLVDITDHDKSHPIGLSAEDKTTGQTMLVRVSGEITNMDTTSFEENDTLYCDSNGDIQNTKPTSGVVIEIGHVIYDHVSSGKILVHQHTPRDYLSTPIDMDIDLRLGDSIGGECVNIENYTDGIVATICSDGEGNFTSLYINNQIPLTQADIIDADNLTGIFVLPSDQEVTISGDNVTSGTIADEFLEETINVVTAVVSPIVDTPLIQDASAIVFQPNGDTDDYLSLSTVGNAQRWTTFGGDTYHYYTSSATGHTFWFFNSSGDLTYRWYHNVNGLAFITTENMQFNAGSEDHFFGADTTKANSQDIYTNDVFTADGGVSAWDIFDNEFYDLELLDNITIKNNAWDLSKLVKRDSKGEVIQSVVKTKLAELTELINVTTFWNETESMIIFNETYSYLVEKNETKEERVGTGIFENQSWISQSELQGYTIGVMKAQQEYIRDLEDRIFSLEIMMDLILSDPTTTTTII